MNNKGSFPWLENHSHMFLTLKTAFSGGCYSAVQSHARKKRPMPHLHNLLWTSVFPTVYASENDNVPKKPDQGQTSQDRLTLSRPVIVVSDKEVRDYLGSETGRDRLKIMFERSDIGHLSAEMDFVISSVRSAAIVTFFISSIYGSRAARVKAIRKQQHQKFDHKIQAVRRINDVTLFGGLKLGLTYALKMSLFVGVFTLTSQSISTYRNKTSVFEYIGAGALTGALAKVPLGPKGMVGGSFVGSVLGLFGGAMITFLLKQSNETFEQRHYWFIHEKLKEQKEICQLASRSAVGTS